jgi:PAT family beta-lactamase induction signal transducer AmpG
MSRPDVLISPEAAAGHPAPPLPFFAILETPYGIQSHLLTFVTMTLMRNTGVSIDRAASIGSLAALPLTFYFLYSPLVDFFVRRRTWALAGSTLSGLLTGAAILSCTGARVQLTTLFLFAAAIFSTFISAATGGLMASLLSPAQKARVGTWVQLGNLGIGALAFGLFEILSEHTTRPVMAIVAVPIMVLPGLITLFIKEPPVTPTGSFSHTFRGIGSELRDTFLSWDNLPGILLLLAPIGVGSITTVLTGLQRDYHATSAQIAFANGWGGGLLTILGTLAALLIPVRWNRMVAYALACTFYGAISLLIGIAPLTSRTIVAGMLASNFGVGLCFGLYTGLLLYIMRREGRCQSSRYTLLNSVGNLPLAYLLFIEGKVVAHFGPRSLGLFDAAANFVPIGIFFAWWAWKQARLPQPTPFLGVEPI